MSTERIILGNNCIFNGNPKETGLNRNVLVVGGTGSGKTVSFVEPALIETLRVTRPHNKIVILTKRELANKYIPLYKDAGFSVYDLDFSNPENGNCCYNPLAYMKSDEDISDLSHAIVMANDRKEHTNADPFWDDSSEQLQGAEIAATLMIKDKATYADVLDLHSSLKIEESGCGITTSLDSVFRRIERTAPDCYAINCWKTFKEAAPRTAKSIYVSMNSTLRAFTASIRNSMRTKPSVDFGKFADEKSILFITTSPVKKALHSLANIFVSQAISELFSIADESVSGTLPIPTDIIFDDFATGAKVADMPEKLSICRAKGIAFLGLLLQSELQLRRMYGEFGAAEIIDNCDHYVFMGGNNYETARALSLKLNVPLEDILYLPVGHIIVFRRGQKPMFSTRYDVYHDEFYKKITKEWEYKSSQRSRER
ncbi:MAG: type IV secretory system conjugative DNA transfer family protein [bacterium]|nr:type IV secretory system conjugative DNA transfer family protein [bacterium]